MKKKMILALLLVLALLMGCQAPDHETTAPAEAAGFTGDVAAYERRHTGRWES